METSFNKALNGYQAFREKYAKGDQSIMQSLSEQGQQPEIMVVSCCDSRVDPALILQCEPGELFVVRNVANIIPPFEKDDAHHGTSAALEFGVCALQVKHLILLGHSQCSGIQALLNSHTANLDAKKDDFITNWVSLVKSPNDCPHNSDDYAKAALNQSYKNCLSFPWIAEKVEQQTLLIHCWFFDIKMGQIFTYVANSQSYQPLALAL